MRRSSLGLIAATTMFVLAATGCGGSGTPTGNANKTLVVDTAFDAHSVDASQVRGATDRLVVQQMYQTLMLPNQKDTSKFDPQIAQSFTVSADGLSYRYQLRHDVHFSDGTQLTSADVVWSLNRFQNIADNNSFLVAGLTFSAPDPYTVVVSAAKPNPSIPYGLSNQAAGVLNSKVVKAHGGTDAADAATTDTAQSYLNQQSAGSGPYALQSFDPQTLIVLKANPNYWGAKPTYSKIEFRNVPATTQTLDVQKSASTVALDLSLAQAQQLDKSKTKTLIEPSVEVFVVALNVNPAVSNVSSNQNFRSAVRYALDYTALRALAGPGAVQATGMIPQGFLGSLPTDKAISRDLTKAKGFLASSGIQSPKISLEYPSDLTDSGVSFSDFAQLVSLNLKDAGINVTLVGEPTVLFKQRWLAGKIPMIVYALGGGIDSYTILSVFAPTQSRSLWMGSSPKPGLAPQLDDAFTQLSAAPTNQERIPLFQKAEMLMDEYAMYIPVFQGNLVVASSSDVGGLNTDSLEEVRFWELT